MIAKSELQTAEEETRCRWKACLALVTAFRHPELARELISGVASKPSLEENEPAPSVVILGKGRGGAKLCAALAEQGVETVEARDLEEAVALTRMDGVRAVVVDETLFNSSSAGWQLRQHKVIPIVLVGSSPDKEGWERAFELEADAYLRKSMGLAEQVARVKAILRRN